MSISSLALAAALTVHRGIDGEAPGPDTAPSEAADLETSTIQPSIQPSIQPTIQPSTQAPPKRRPVYLADDERSAIPRRFRYRGASLGLGAALYFDRKECDPLVAVDVSGCVVGRTAPLLLVTTPALDLLAELGWRHVRGVLGVFTRPRPHVVTDGTYGLLFGVEAGILVGYERLRGGVTVGVGYQGFQVLGRLLVTPWRDRRGGRHGLDATFGQENGAATVSFGYRFAPAALNHRGGRRAAKRRAAANGRP